MPAIFTFILGILAGLALGEYQMEWKFKKACTGILAGLALGEYQMEWKFKKACTKIVENISHKGAECSVQ